MTLPASGTLSLSQVNTEIGAAATTNRSLSWVQSNTYYAYTNMNSLHSLAWFTAVSSQNSASRTTGSTTTNCVANCYSPSAQCSNCNDCGACTNWPSPNYDTPRSAINCNQCGYNHGTYLQANCNCNCNCSNCNCYSSNCNACTTCDCATCITGDTLLLTRDGIKPIMDIRAGDYIADDRGEWVLVRELHYVPLTSRTVWLVNNKLRITGDHAIKTTTGPRSIEPDRRRFGVLEWEFFQNFTFPDQALEGLTLNSISGDQAIFSISRTDPVDSMFSVVCEGGSGYMKLPTSGIIVEYLFPRKQC